MSIENKDISKFYDGYTDRQEKWGIHVRHRTILKLLKNCGLKPGSSILEVGCGIGTVTHLLGKYCRSGKIVAADISAKSIEVAKQKNRSFGNIEFVVSDMSDFSHKLKFDFIVLPDVLEHIPVEQHRNLFSRLKECTHENSVILINIPNPPYLRWVHKNRPDLLQIIDQPLDTCTLLNDVYENDFYLHSLNVYSLSIEEGDYQSIVLKRGRYKALDRVTELPQLKKSYLKQVSKFY
ncbi:MAG TPA: class I SAM-dependent methyltransferase [Bacteroidia bacterium]|jgi:trans-aconitate methyltransferase